MISRFDFDIFISTFPKLLKALPITLSVGVIAMILGLAIGIGVAVIRQAQIPILKTILRAYVSFFRGTPLMIQLFLFFFGLPQLFPILGNLNAFEASILIMSLNAGAYISETIRSSINAIDQLQFDAGYSIGLDFWQTMYLIIMPQAIKVAILPLGNTFIGVIQGTALTFMLGLRDIMGTSKMLAATHYRFFETYLAVGLMYWGITLVIGRFNYYLEQKFSKEVIH